MKLIEDTDFTLHVGDALDVLRTLPSGSVDCCITSPPYLAARPEYKGLSLDVWDEICHELQGVVNGPILLNLGRLWSKGRELRWHEPVLDIAARYGFGLCDTLVWVKPNANPIHGHFLVDSHEYVYVLGQLDVKLHSDAIRTEYDSETLARFTRKYKNHTGVKGEVREAAGRKENKDGARARSFVISFVGREKGNPHPSPMPLDLAEHLVRFGSWIGETVLDPFLGSGTTALAARRLGRRCVGIELSPVYAQLAARRTQQLSVLA